MVDVGERVRIHCVGRLDDGSLFCDSRQAEEPVEFVLGSQTLLPAVEDAVRTLEPGTARTVRIPAEQAYGVYDDSLVETVLPAQFPGWERLPVGEYIEMQTDSGSLRVKVVSADEDAIRFDHNHELAGKDLTFDLELVEIVKPDTFAHEAHAANCGCGCQRLKASLLS